MIIFSRVFFQAKFELRNSINVFFLYFPVSDVKGLQRFEHYFN